MRRLGFHERWSGGLCSVFLQSIILFLLMGRLLIILRHPGAFDKGTGYPPYLFLLCTEGISALLWQAVHANKILAHKMGRGGPSFQHLLLADDSLLFFKRGAAEAEVIKNIILVYERASGQKVNFQKSTISFSPNVGEVEKSQIAYVLEVPIVDCHSIYLGLPTRIGRNKRTSFKPILDRVWAKLQSWEGRLLSAGGKEVLIKAVI